MGDKGLKWGHRRVLGWQLGKSCPGEKEGRFIGLFLGSSFNGVWTQECEQDRALHLADPKPQGPAVGWGGSS